MAVKPHFSPNASFTHTKTPPSCGHPVASSAETRDAGMRYTTKARRQKKIDYQPTSLCDGMIRILMIAAKVIRMNAVNYNLLLIEGFVDIVRP